MRKVPQNYWRLSTAKATPTLLRLHYYNYTTTRNKQPSLGPRLEPKLEREPKQGWHVLVVVAGGVSLVCGLFIIRREGCRIRTGYLDTRDLLFAPKWAQFHKLLVVLRV